MYPVYDSGTLSIGIKYADLYDSSRQREVPIKIYYPLTEVSFPVIFFSHGLGRSREGGAFWGEFLASHGYVCIHIQHPGSDTEILKSARIRKRAKVRDIFSHANAENLILRVQDSKFCIDKLSEINSSFKELKGKIDTSKIGFSGHSFGAITTQCMAGQAFNTGKDKNLSFPDSRVKGFIAFSPTVTKRMDEKSAFEKIVKPFFSITGDEDEIDMIRATAEERRIPYDNMPGGNKFLLILKGADHAALSGQKRWRDSDKDDTENIKLIKISILAFWDAYLKENKEAKKFLNSELVKFIGEKGSFERK